MLTALNQVINYAPAEWGLEVSSGNFKGPPTSECYLLHTTISNTWR